MCRRLSEWQYLVQFCLFRLECGRWRVHSWTSQNALQGGVLQLRQHGADVGRQSPLRRCWNRSLRGILSSSQDAVKCRLLSKEECSKEILVPPNTARVV